MLLQYIKDRLDTHLLKEDFRKMGVNFITAGIVGVFVNHYVGISFPNMIWTALSITGLGIWFLYIGVRRK